MFNWLREYFELKREYKACESCETLRRQLEIANREKEVLLNRIINPIVPEVKSVEQIEPKMIMPRAIPWNVRRQMLEAEDRKKAELLKAAPVPKISNVEELEKEIAEGQVNKN